MLLPVSCPPALRPLRSPAPPRTCVQSSAASAPSAACLPAELFSIQSGRLDSAASQQVDWSDRCGACSCGAFRLHRLAIRPNHTMPELQFCAAPAHIPLYRLCFAPALGCHTWPCFSVQWPLLASCSEEFGEEAAFLAAGAPSGDLGSPRQPQHPSPPTQQQQQQQGPRPSAGAGPPRLSRLSPFQQDPPV